MRMQHRRWLTTCAVAAVLVVSSCAVADEPEFDLDAARQAVDEVIANGSESEACIWEDAQPAFREWNRVAAELVADYLDLSVSAEAYVQTSRRLLPALEQVLYDLQDVRDCIAPFNRELMRPFVSTYNRKLTALQAFETAVLIGSFEGEQDAVAMLDAANNETMELACELADLLQEELQKASC
jgi:hypothetical protein